MRTFLTYSLVLLPLMAVWCPTVGVIARLFGVKAPFWYWGTQSRQQVAALTKSQYVCVTGVLWWGGLMALFTIARYYFIDKSRPFGLRGVIIEVLVWALGGVVFGLSTWNDHRSEGTVPSP